MSRSYPIDCLVVIADGEQARIFRNKAGDGSLDLVAEGVLTPKELEDDGPAGKRPVESTPRETDEATFAKQLAMHLNKMAEQDQFASMVLVADPQTLGQIRPSLHKQVQDRLHLEHPKTLTNAGMDEILRSLS